MKRLVKVCLAICLLLVVAGGTLCIVAVSQGFRFYEISKVNLLDFADNREDRHEASKPARAERPEVSNVDGQQVFENDYYAYDISNIDMELSFGNVYILPAKTNDYISVEIAYDESKWNDITDEIDCQVENETLEISYDADSKWDWFSLNDSVEVRLYLPDLGDKFNEIEMEFGAASVEFDGAVVIADSIKIDMGAGELRVDSSSELVAHDLLKVQTGAGRIDLDQVKAERLDVSCAAGSINLATVDAMQTKLDCGLGSISATMLGMEEDYSYDIEAGIGNIEFGDQEFAKLGADKKETRENADREITVNGGVGNVDIEFGDF